jgi:hypothetical protein
VKHSANFSSPCCFFMKSLQLFPSLFSAALKIRAGWNLNQNEDTIKPSSIFEILEGGTLVFQARCPIVPMWGCFTQPSASIMQLIVRDILIQLNMQLKTENLPTLYEMHSEKYHAPPMLAYYKDSRAIQAKSTCRLANRRSKEL